MTVCPLVCKVAAPLPASASAIMSDVLVTGPPPIAPSRTRIETFQIEAVALSVIPKTETATAASSLP